MIEREGIETQARGAAVHFNGGGESKLRFAPTDCLLGPPTAQDTQSGEQRHAEQSHAVKRHNICKREAWDCIKHGGAIIQVNRPGLG
jgi:hypothetical protein